VNGVRWTIETRTTPEFFSRASMRFPWSVFGGGLLASTLLFLLVFAAQRYSARLLDEANSANRAKDEFLATLSHELRTPLSVILGHSELLKSGSADALDTAESIDAIHRNARVQSQIINDLLDVSSIITGKVSMEKGPVSIRQPVKAALDTVRFGAMVKSITIGLDFGDEDLFVHGDPIRLQQVFWNLISNAVKFTPRSGHIGIEIRGNGETCEVAISDTGQGIAPEFMPYVFDSFRQEDGGTTRRFGGLGLGLSIVSKLVRLHGGTVRVSSAGRDLGSRFTVVLPLVAKFTATVIEDSREIQETVMSQA
jgi:signal transduction histidine kinase